MYVLFSAIHNCNMFQFINALTIVIVNNYTFTTTRSSTTITIILIIRTTINVSLDDKYGLRNRPYESQEYKS